MLRLFVGLPLPDHIRAALAALIGGVPGARWVAAESYHVTLQFIGEVDDPQADDLHGELLRVTAPSFDLKIRGVGSFGTRTRPSSLWAGIDKMPPLTFLKDKVDRAVVAAGFEAEDRKFMPHVTLARLRQAPPHRVAGWEGDHNLLSLPAFRVTAFTLFRSYLGSERARYEALADYPLVDPVT